MMMKTKNTVYTNDTKEIIIQNLKRYSFFFSENRIVRLRLFRGVLYVRKMFISEITAGLIFFFQEYLESELHDTIRTIRIYLHFRAHRIVS